MEVPERGSDLAIDDAIFPHMAISQLARMSLVLAGEHLRLALDAIQAQQLYPSSHFTVLRGALVGASQAVWILGPKDRGQRRERGFTVLAEMYTQMGKLSGPGCVSVRLASPPCEWVRRASISPTSSARRRITSSRTVRIAVRRSLSAARIAE